MKPRVWLAALLSIQGALQAGQSNTGGAQQAVPILTQPWGSARAIGMGTAFEAMDAGLEAVAYNPSAAGGLAGPELLYGHEAWLAGTGVDRAQAGLPFGGLGVLAVGGDWVSYPTVALRDSSGNYLGSATPQDWDINLAWGRDWGPVALGLQAADVHDQFLSSSTKCWDYGAGLRAGLGSLDLALVLRELPAQTLDSQRWLSQGVFSAAWQSGPALGGRYDACTSLRLIDSVPGEWAVGVEAVYGGRLGLALRAGLDHSLAGQDLSPWQGFSAGFGFNLGGLDLDYAFVPYDSFGNTHHLSARWSFAAETKASGPDPAVVPLALPASDLAAPSAMPVSGSAAPLRSPTAAAAATTTGPAATTATADALTPPQDRAPVVNLHVLGDLDVKGRELQAAGKNFEAMKVYLDAVNQDNADLEAWRGLARVYAALGRADYARNCWQRVLVLDPADPEAAAALAGP
jgi:hypothetical protein